MFKLRWQIGLVAIALLVLVSCGVVLERSPGVRAPIANANLVMGNPSNASTDPNNYLLEKQQYVVSYNNSKHILNWSSWQLNQSWLGTVPRNNNFRPDESLPKGFYQVRSSDYNGSGFDRGHMTPSGDRSNTPTDNAATFLMTNILPQAPDNNQGPWAELENYSRDLVRQGKELYIIAGGYGSKRSIGKGDIKITVPDRVWKVIVVLDKPGLGTAGVNASTRIIAVDMPNIQGIKEEDWRKYRVSVDLVEDKTGYNFLTNVPDAIQVQVEGKSDRN
jgi:endonuclease G, mitochondrial